MSSELEKTNPETEISVVLDKLSNLLEKAILIASENREAAKRNHDYFKNLMMDCHESSDTISEDGVLEKSTNDSMRLLIDSAKVLDGPIMALTKVLTTKMNVEAIKNSNGRISGPIDIDNFK